ncbi:hypothetical protein GQ457_18G011970 [Hibiscus cannabinus]
MGKHTSDSIDRDVGTDRNGLDSGNHPRWRMNELWIGQQHSVENELEVQTSSKEWLPNEEVDMVSHLNSDCQAEERVVLIDLNLVNLVDSQVDFESLLVEPREVEPMDARFIVPVEPLDTHVSRNLLDFVFSVESKRKNGKGKGKGTIQQRSLTLWRQEGKEDQGITFVQVQFGGYGSMYKQWGGYRYSGTSIGTPLEISLVSIHGKEYRYPSSLMELEYRYWLSSTGTGCLRTKTSPALIWLFFVQLAHAPAACLKASILPKKGFQQKIVLFLIYKIMVATAATSAFFPVTSSPDSSESKNKKLGGGSTSLESINSKPLASSGSLQVKANAQAHQKINGSTVVTTPVESSKNDDGVSSPPPRTFINQLPDWSMLLAAITTIFLAAEKQWMMLDWKPRRPDMVIDPFGIGKIVQDGLVYSENFSIRSYEIGADRTASIETLMNHLQETAINHCRNAGLLGEGFGATPEMCKKNLIWVVTRMQVVIDRYPTWGDVVQVDTWVSASGKNGMRRDWLVSNSETGEILTRATSVWVMMNKLTRRLSKIPEEVRGEIELFFMISDPVLAEDRQKLVKLDDSTAENVCKGLTPKWGDLDVNQHVNNVKYIGWILESAPLPILESHELCAMTLEYRRECGRDSVLQSLTAVSDSDVENTRKFGEINCQHLLRLENGAEIVRGRTRWRPKDAKSLCNVDKISAERA